MLDGIPISESKPFLSEHLRAITTNALCAACRASKRRALKNPLISQFKHTAPEIKLCHAEKQGEML
jgi:hypothetical protein